jgi:hypothetical protein
MIEDGEVREESDHNEPRTSLGGKARTLSGVYSLLCNPPQDVRSANGDTPNPLTANL